MISLDVVQKAEAELAYELQAAKTKQRIKEEQMQILVVERTQEIAVQDQEIQRRERELEATIRRPAEAEKYKYVHFLLSPLQAMKTDRGCGLSTYLHSRYLEEIGCPVLFSAVFARKSPGTHYKGG